MSHDPILKAAMHEIESVCKKYDCSAFVSLHSRTHGEFRYILPDWSQLRILETGWHIKAHMKSNKEDSEATVAFIFQLHDIAANVFLATDQAINLLKKRFNVSHIPFNEFEPHKPKDKA